MTTPKSINPTRLTLQSLFLTLFLITSTGSACAQEEPVHGTIKVTRGANLESLAEITPAQARAAAAKKLPGATFQNVELEEEDGYLVYSVALVRDGEQVEVLVDAGDASILSVENDEDGDRAGVASREEAEDERGEEEDSGEAGEREEAGEVSLSADDLPGAVREAFESSYPNATILAVAREHEGGEDFFEIESRDGETRRDLLYRPDGRVYEVEEAIPAARLPEAVRAAVTRRFPGSRILTAEQVKRDAIVLYEMVLGKEGKRRNATFRADGEIVEAPKEP